MSLLLLLLLLLLLFLFQWYKGKELLPGATESTLALALRPVPKMILDVAKNNADTNLDSEVFFREQKRFYRCARCKQISKEVNHTPCSIEVPISICSQHPVNTP